MNTQVSFSENQTYEFEERIMPIDALPANVQLAVGEPSKGLVKTLAAKGGMIECRGKYDADQLTIYSGSRSVKAARAAIEIAKSKGNHGIATQLSMVRVIIYDENTPESYMHSLALSMNFNRSDNIPDEISHIREALKKHTVEEIAESIGASKAKFIERYGILTGNKEHLPLSEEYIDLFIEGRFTFGVAKQIFKLNTNTRLFLLNNYREMCDDNPAATITEDMVIVAFRDANKTFKQLAFGETASSFSDYDFGGVNTDVHHTLVEMIEDDEKEIEHKATFKGIDGYIGIFYRPLSEREPEATKTIRDISNRLRRHLEGGMAFNVPMTIAFLEQLEGELDELVK